MKKAYIILGIALLGLFAMWYISGREEKVPVQAEYPDKIVYTLDLSFPLSELEHDCTIRGGSFNSCGAPCATSEPVCEQVCAYTCEF